MIHFSALKAESLTVSKFGDGDNWLPRTIINRIEVRKETMTYFEHRRQQGITPR